MKNYYAKYTPFLFLIPAMFVLLVFFFIPFFDSLMLSFQNFDHSLYNPTWVGFDNYRALIGSKVFWQVLWNTIVFMVVAVPILVVLPIIIAVLLSQNLRGITIYRVITYIPVIISIVVAGIAFKWLYNYEGLLNYLISFIGISKIEWLTSPDVALYSVIALTVWKGLGYYAMIYLAALTTAPKELYEACDIDGASILRKHLAITIPHLMPTISLVAVISSISAMKVFVEIYVMTQGGPMNSTKTIVYYIYQRAFENLDIGVASACGIVLLIITMGLSMFNVKMFENQHQVG
ncbi:MAG: sugar ABC transporter permease [Candidatus Gastranaerophilales bacterium]|nr:sugar ABC transporter permease [Candidatus Gastranaerophilales bacterium]